MNIFSLYGRLSAPVCALGLIGGLLVGVGCSSAPAKPDEDAAVSEPKAPAGAELLGTVETTSAYQIGDIMLIHRETPANAVVAARVYISGGAANLTPENAGIERLALNIATKGGTKSRPKDEFNALLDSMGASVSSFTDRDYSGYSMQSTVEYFEPTWELLFEAMVEPAMPEAELDLQRSRHLAAIKSLHDSPDSLGSHTALKLLFTEHPYLNFQLGTAENVEGFELDELAAYQQSLLHPEDMTVVVVGNVPVDKLVEQVQRLNDVPEGEPRPHQELVPFKDTGAAIAVEEKDIPTNYIYGLFPAPAPGAEDYEAMLVAIEYLSDRLFEEVRTNRNLSYAVSAGLSDRRVNYGLLYVTAVNPSETMPVMFEEIEKLKNGDFDPEDLNESRNVFITRHYMSMETNSSQASLLARSQLIAGDWTRFAESIDRLQAVTPEDVERVAKEYLKDYRFGVVGDPGDIDQELFLSAADPASTRPEREGAAPEDKASADKKPTKIRPIGTMSKDSAATESLIKKVYGDDPEDADGAGEDQTESNDSSEGSQE